MSDTAPVKRSYLRRRPDGKCAVDGCQQQAYGQYARCGHHRHLRSHYGSDERPPVTEPDHGTLARYRGSKTRPACACDACREANSEARRQWVRRQPRKRGPRVNTQRKGVPGQNGRPMPPGPAPLPLDRLARYEAPDQAHGAEESGPLDWQEQALCRQVDVGEIFFPEKGGATQPAKRVCRECPVSEQCLRYALDNDERFGIWGGKSERERRRIRRAA